MVTAWQKLARCLLILALLDVLNGCGFQKTYSRPILQELPVPAEIKLETDAIVKKTPSGVKSPSSTLEPDFYIHRVRWPGETFSAISQWYTGSWKNWKPLSQANPSLHPNRIKIGDNIFIPEALLKSRKPMPISFLSLSVRKKSVQEFPSEKSSTESDAVDLFEPIDTHQPPIKSHKVGLFGPIETEQTLIGSDAPELFGPKDIK
ncbi:MAG: LysM peptidoglycan-binding domain-containing protein [Deltaproteobacteria bacterium]|nr:LysM peptidoglycan-binding domain-containing protein [Deltaproteobacteria bacterium]